MNLTRNNSISRKGPVVFIILDGMGIGPGDEGDAFHHARTPFFDECKKTGMYTEIKAHGTWVGLPDNSDMGNSEVGHNALGAGRIFAQGAKLVNNAIADGSIFQGKCWQTISSTLPENKGALHFIGLLSDGNVHSHIDHLFAMIDRAAQDGIEKVRVHALLDGRDVPDTSAHIYLEKLETFLEGHRAEGRNYIIASGGGRMTTTMDRYEADWDMVKRGWEAHVLGTARHFPSAMEALETFRKEEPGITDQYLPAFTVAEKGEPLGPVVDGDAVIFFNFRGDRAMEISRAFEEENFTPFDRQRRPDVIYTGMMEYDGDLHIPSRFLVEPPDIDKTMSEYLAAEKVPQFAISETQKFGHVTYFWNGNRSGKFDETTEVYQEIPSDRVPFDQRPWMKAAEITDAVLEALALDKYPFIRLNYANGDMVGHTGKLEAAITAAQVIDLSLERLLKGIKKAGGIAVITADHGNLDEMFQRNKKTGSPEINPETGKPSPKTSHTLNPVPFLIMDYAYNDEYELVKDTSDMGLANVAATLLMLLGFEPPEEYEAPLITLK